MEDPWSPPCRADGAHQGRWIGWHPGRGLRTDHTPVRGRSSSRSPSQASTSRTCSCDSGLYQPRPPYPFTPGYEVSIIAATGAEVGLAVGVESLRRCRMVGRLATW